MKKISRSLFVSFLFLASVSLKQALAGGSCGPTGCSAISISPPVQRAPATASAAHAFTAIGGSRVADVNLSQEARERIKEGDKELPLPKGFITAADRAKANTKKEPLYGWGEDDYGPRTRSNRFVSPHVFRNSPNRGVQRSARPVRSATTINIATSSKATSRH